MTRPPVLSDEQRRAVERNEPVRTVRASAGAGKTLVLVETYLHHVAEGARPDQILAITFTRKAASEMKRRIVARLREMGLPDAAQIAETGPIQTIHSFCERLLRENALEAGVAPDFTVLSEAELGNRVEDAVRDEISQVSEDEPEAARLIRRLAGTTRWGLQPTLRARLAAAVMQWLKEMRGSGFSPSSLAERYASPESLWSAFLTIGAPELPAESPAALVAEALRREAPKGAKLRSKDAAEELEDLRDACGLAQIALGVWRALEKRMEAEQSFDFTDLEARAVRLLERSGVVRRRLATNLRAVLVDEAQDVNPVQYRLLDALRAPSQMMVGDPQQSIYGFRLADRTLFDARTQAAPCDALTANFRSEPGILRFIDHVFAQLWLEAYTPMAPPDAPGIGFAGVEFWRSGCLDSRQVAVWTRDLLAELARESDPMSARDVAVLARSAGTVGRIAGALADIGVAYRIVGGTERFYTRMEVRDLANALRAVADPTDDFALLAVLHSPLVGLSLDAVALLGLEPPVLERLGTFVSPLPDDGERLGRFLDWFVPLSAYADRLAAWEVLAAILRHTPYLETIARRRDAAQRLANVRKLLAIAADLRELGPQLFAEHIRSIQSLQHREGEAPIANEDEDAVTILTIHKAKGLEFPVVIVPDLYQNRQRRSPELVFERKIGLVATKFGKDPALLYQWLAERTHLRDEAEELRVLYVALTRARRRLCVAVGLGGSSKHLAGRLAATIGPSDAPPPGVVVRGVASSRNDR